MVETKEKMTLISVSNWAKLKEGREGQLGPKAVSSDGNDRNSCCSVGWCPEGSSRRQKEQKAGVRANIPTQASWPVIEVGSDGGVMRGCGDPFGKPWSRVAYRGCSFLVGANAAVVTTTEIWLVYKTARQCSCARSNHSSYREQLVKAALDRCYCAALCDVMEVSGGLGGRLQRWRGHDWTRR